MGQPGTVISPSSHGESDGIIVGYWTIRGLAAALRMMVMYSGTLLKCDHYDLVMKPPSAEGSGGVDASCWLSRKAELKAKDPLINLPYVMDGDLVVSQTNACLAYLGRKLGLWGNNEKEVVMCESLLCELMDLRNKMTTFVYTPIDAESLPAAAKALLDGVAGPSGILQKLELCLDANKKDGGGSFFVTDHATAPDFHCWELLTQYVGLAAYVKQPNPLTDYPLLAAFLAKFADLPGNAKYLASPLAKLPFNQKMASYGANPCGAAWMPGQEWGWGSVDAVYC